MASHGSYQHGVIRLLKDCHLMFPIPGLKQGNLRVPSTPVRTKLISGFPESTQFIAPVLVEQGARHEKVIKFLMSGIRGSDGDFPDLSLLSELVEFQVTITDLHRHQAATDSPGFDLCVEMEAPFVHPSDIILKSIDDFPLHQAILINPDGKISILGSANEMKDLLLLLAEFYFPNGSASWYSRQRMLVPQFKWVAANDACSTQQRLKVDPLMSLKKAKSGSTQGRKAKKRVPRERNLYQNNYYSACASFLGLMMDKNHDGMVAIKSFKRTGPELHKLLLELSSTISGAGATVLLSVLCNLAYGRVQFDTSNFLTTSVGLGLFWLSWAVYKLRETIVYIKKSPANLSSEEVEEMGRKLDKSVNGIYRSAAFTAVAVLSLP